MSWPWPVAFAVRHFDSEAYFGPVAVVDFAAGFEDLTGFSAAVAATVTAVFESSDFVATDFFDFAGSVDSVDFVVAAVVAV